MAKQPKDLFAGIKRGSTKRPTKAPREPEEVRPLIAESDKMVTIALTMPRALFERYNAGKSRGHFRDGMVRQLEKKFEQDPS